MKLRNFCKTRVWALINAFVMMLIALFWLALRLNWSGISKALGANNTYNFIVMEIPLIICIILWLLFAYAVVAMLLFPTKKRHQISLSALNVVFFVIIIVVIALGGMDYIMFTLPKFFRSVLAALLLITLAIVLFFMPAKDDRRSVALKSAILALVLVCSMLVGYGWEVPGISYKPVVYAVEDDYQIVFSSHAKSIAWVTVDGDNYYDLYNGSMQSSSLVHKVTVPQEALDGAKSYSVSVQKMIYRGPFGGYKGKVITETYNFRPVDLSDGLQYYSMSDVHAALKGVTAAAKYKADTTDFYVLAGDLLSMLDSEADANFANKVAFAVTGGQRPVIYARGNHEIKGNIAEQLHRYVGSKNGQFYYTVSLAGGKVFGTVLDIGEDHDDDWWEYYGTAQFDVYRQEQTEFLTDVRDNYDFTGVQYKLAVCHVPVVFINNRADHETFKREWTALLNDIGIDMMISGHQHELYPLVAGVAEREVPLVYNDDFSGSTGKKYNGRLTDANFSNILISRRADSQKGTPDEAAKGKFIGLYTDVDFAAGQQTSCYTNAKGEIVPVVHPFANVRYDDGLIVTELLTK
jgi:predicted phosphodiesterase